MSGLKFVVSPFNSSRRCLPANELRQLIEKGDAVEPRLTGAARQSTFSDDEADRAGEAELCDGERRVKLCIRHLGGPLMRSSCMIEATGLRPTTIWRLLPKDSRHPTPPNPGQITVSTETGQLRFVGWESICLRRGCGSGMLPGR